MKTVIQLVLVALVLGGASAAGTVLWQRQQTALNDANKRAETAEAKLKEDPLASLQQPAVEVQQQEDVPEEKPEPPVAVRPQFSEGSDEAGHLVVALNQRLRAVQEKEQHLQERQEALKLIFSDIRTEQQQINQLRQQVGDELGKSSISLQETLRSAQDERALLRQELDSLQGSPSKPDSVEKSPDAESNQAPAPGGSNPSASTSPNSTTDGAAAKRLGAIYDSMPAEVVADVFQQLTKSGREDAVVQLLQTMKDRQAAKVLATIASTDAALAASLTEKLKRH